jgi:hypothetical protein
VGTAAAFAPFSSTKALSQPPPLVLQHYSSHHIAMEPDKEMNEEQLFVDRLVINNNKNTQQQQQQQQQAGAKKKEEELSTEQRLSLACHGHGVSSRVGSKVLLLDAATRTKHYCPKAKATRLHVQPLLIH